MVRFPQIRMIYNISDSHFNLPALTVQPMVENAIRHGVRIRQDGVVTVRTSFYNGNHVIMIRDNGIGFDPSTLETADAQHIGFRNVRERIEKMCGGTLTVESRLDEGTTVEIRIPDRTEDAM